MKDKSLKIKYILFALAAVLVAAADQVTKAAVGNWLKYTGSTKVIIEGLLSFTYVHNEGAAFGIMQGKKIVFIIITAIVFAAAVWYFKKYKPSHPLELSAAALILSGAVGNLIDRVWLGYVRDFIEVTFINFPVFNVADCAICIGAVLVIIYAFMDMKKAEKNDG